MPNIWRFAHQTPQNLSHQMFQMLKDLAQVNNIVPNLERYRHKCKKKKKIKILIFYLPPLTYFFISIPWVWASYSLPLSLTPQPHHADHLALTPHMLCLQLALSAILPCHPPASPPPCSAGHLAMPPPRQATPMPPDLSLLISELMGMLVFFFVFVFVFWDGFWEVNVVS